MAQVSERREHGDGEDGSGAQHAAASPPSYTHRIIDVVDREAFAFVAPSDIDTEALLERLRGEAMIEQVERERVDDSYLDSEGFELRRAGLRARYRRRSPVNGSRRQATRRLEVEPIVLLPELAFERHVLSRRLSRVDGAGEELSDFLLDALALATQQKLQPQLTVQAERVTYRVAGVGCEARLCIADQRARASSRHRSGAAKDKRGKRAQRIVELWLTLERGEKQSFEVLAKHLRELGDLADNRATTHELAQAALSIKPPKLGAAAPQFSAGDSADSIARAICKGQLETIESYAEGTRLSLDAEYLHKMRVATRRLRAALRNFAGCFDARAETYLLAELRWLAAVLGEVRDFDVHLIDYANWREMLGPQPPHGWHQLRGELVTRREARKMAMRRALASTRYRKLIARAHSVFSKAPPRRRDADHPGRQTAAEHAAAHIGKRVKQVRRAARVAVSDATGEGVHELRIRCKKLRYTAEFYAPLFGKKMVKRVKRLSSLQDRLGKFQDCMIAGELVERLRGEAAREGTDDPTDYGFVLGLIGGWARASAHGADVEADDALDDIGGDDYLKDLRRRVAALADKQRSPKVESSETEKSPRKAPARPARPRKATSRRAKSPRKTRAAAAKAERRDEESDASAVPAKTRNGRSAAARRRRQPASSAGQQGATTDRASGPAARANGRGTDSRPQ